MSATRSKNNSDDGQQDTTTIEPAVKPDKQRMTEAADPGSKQPQAAQTSIEVDDSQVTAQYANFGRVSSMPEEVIMDLEVNMQALGVRGPHQALAADHPESLHRQAVGECAVDRHPAARASLRRPGNQRAETCAAPLTRKGARRLHASIVAC